MIFYFKLCFVDKNKAISSCYINLKPVQNKGHIFKGKQPNKTHTVLSLNFSVISHAHCNSSLGFALTMYYLMRIFQEKNKKTGDGDKEFPVVSKG